MEDFVKLTQEDLDKILALHLVYSKGDYGGEEARVCERDMSNLDFHDADLREAYFRNCHFTCADLSGADFTGAEFCHCDLTGVNFRGAVLTGVIFKLCVLDAAGLHEANLTPIKADLFKVLDLVPHEAPGLLEVLRAGQINGSVYNGDCACLVGTIAKLRSCEVWELEDAVDIRTDFDRPIEKWFFSIKEGHTPENSATAAITAGWIEEWIRENKQKLNAYRKEHTHGSN